MPLPAPSLIPWGDPPGQLSVPSSPPSPLGDTEPWGQTEGSQGAVTGMCDIKTLHGDTQRGQSWYGDAFHGDAREGDTRYSVTRYGDNRHVDTHSKGTLNMGTNGECRRGDSSAAQGHLLWDILLGDTWKGTPGTGLLGRGTTAGSPLVAASPPPFQSPAPPSRLAVERPTPSLIGSRLAMNATLGGDEEGGYDRDRESRS